MKRALLRPEKTIDNAAEEEYYIAYKTGRHYKRIKDTDEMNRQAFREAFRRSIPILCSYAFVGMAYGIMIQEAGQPWFLSPAISVTVYTGAFQFVLISFLAGGTSLGVIAVTALLMNSRQAFYSLTFMDDFNRMGRRRPYMICTMTDETYAVNCSLPQEMPGRRDVMFYTAILSKFYWVAASLCGALAGSLIPWDLEGIDFCMTALFVIILLDQWEHTKDHRAALLGGGVAVVCLLIFGGSAFMLPALLATSGALVFANRREGTAK